MNDRTFPAAMIERDFKRVQIKGLTQWRGLKIIITKIADIHKLYPLDKYKKLMEQLPNNGVGVEDKRDLVDLKTLSCEEVEVITEIIKILKNNNNNVIGSREIDNIKKLFSKKRSTNSPDREKRK